MYNFDTKRRVESRDVVWLNKMYHSQDGQARTHDPYLMIESATQVDKEDGYINLNQEVLEMGDEDITDEIMYLGNDNPESSESNTNWEPANGPRYPTREKTQRILYNPTSGGDITVADICLVQNFSQGLEFASTIGAVQLFKSNLQEIDNKEVLEVVKAHNRYYTIQGVGYEVQAVGAGVGGGFTNTTELIPMKYQEAINGPDGKAWAIECDKEHDRMLKNNVFQVVERRSLEPGVKVIDSTWNLKKKSSGILRGRLTVRGFKQIDGEHFDSANIHAPVANSITIRVVVTLMMMGNLDVCVVDVDMDKYVVCPFLECSHC